MARRHNNQEQTPLASSPEQNSQEKGSASKDSLKKDVTMFFVVILFLIGGIAGLWWYDQQSQIITNWAKSIPLPINNDQGASIEPKVQIDTGSEEIQVEVQEPTETIESETTTNTATSEENSQ